MPSFTHTKYQAQQAPAMAQRRWPDRVIEHAPIWASVDLRDGNQALLEPMNMSQKGRLWDLLVKIGFKEIEVGFPSASRTDYDFVRALIDEERIPEDVTLQVLVQAREDLIIRTFEALRGVRKAIVHVYNSTSTVQRERVFCLGREGVKEIAVRGAQWLKRESEKYPDTHWTFEYSPESFSNTEPDYALEVCEGVLDVWAPTPQHPCIINLPATVESATPNVFADQVEYFARHVSRRDAIVLSVHTHNDRGTAVAAAELALLAGAERVEGTLFGNGERTGNMDIVTLMMNLYSQGIDPGLHVRDPDEMMRIYTECTQLPIHPRHPWLGELVYTAFSGSHQDAIRKCLAKQRPDETWQVAYLPIDPRDLGRDYQEVIRVNSQSGKGGVAFVLERDYGLRLPRWMQLELAQVVQRESERSGGEVESAAIHRCFTDHFLAHRPLHLEAYRLESDGNEDRVEAHVEEDGREILLWGRGMGAISAFVDGLARHDGRRIHVLDYNEHAIGEGTNAEAISYVQINIDGFRVSGAAIDRDTVSASLKALLSAVNRVLTRERPVA